MNKIDLRKEMVIVVLVQFIILVALGISTVDLIGVKHHFETESAAQKKEIDEWRLASLPAIYARGWEDFRGQISNPSKITPELLGYALNPCYKTPAGDWDTSVPECGGENQKGKTVAIAIVPLHLKE